MDLHKEIIKITSEYLKDTIDYSKLSKASKDYRAILNKICEKDMDIDKGRNDIEFNNGKALGTFWAALCVDDMIRTRQFIRGIHTAVQENINQKKPLHILYAGTGPFATLLLPTILRYSKLDLKYTFLEVNPFSFELLQKMILKLGLENHDINLLNEDATKYKINAADQPDIIISETMQNALAKEQQVPIYLNLMTQVKNNTIFIPEKIALSIALKKSGIPIEKLKPEHFHKEQKVFEVGKEIMLPSNTSDKQTVNKVAFTKKQTFIENKKLKGFNQLAIITEIQVYKDFKININESGLTTPIFINEIPENLKGAVLLDTQYHISSEPKLNYTVIFPNTI